jgi:hypothetical protein
MDSFIKLNKIIIKYIYNKDILDIDLRNLSNKIIRKYYGKKIKYLEKIKKYI